jgi:hypothetical protein
VNRADEALSVFEQARSLDPASGLPLVNIGTVHLMRGDAVRGIECVYVGFSA